MFFVQAVNEWDIFLFTYQPKELAENNNLDKSSTTCGRQSWLEANAQPFDVFIWNLACNNRTCNEKSDGFNYFLRKKNVVFN